MCHGPPCYSLATPLCRPMQKRLTNQCYATEEPISTALKLVACAFACSHYFSGVVILSSHPICAPTSISPSETKTSIAMVRSLITTYKMLTSACRAKLLVVAEEEARCMAEQDALTQQEMDASAQPQEEEVTLARQQGQTHSRRHRRWSSTPPFEA